MMLLFLCAALTALPGVAGALERGAPIRITMVEGRTIEARILAVDEQRLTFRHASGEASVPMARISLLETRVGSRSRGFWRGAAVGLLTGLAVGYVAHGSSGSETGLWPVFGLVYGLPLGVAGGTVGAISADVKWLPVRLDRDDVVQATLVR